MRVVLGHLDFDERACRGEHFLALVAQVPQADPLPGFLVTLGQSAQRFETRVVTHLGIFEVDDEALTFNHLK